jgi:hypothetical protein
LGSRLSGLLTETNNKKVETTKFSGFKNQIENMFVNMFINFKRLLSGVSANCEPELNGVIV